ncbi:M28 family metallopeptidase [Lysobacter sp. cf310]|uniref:M28 family metallopeptidase n=1 Tax=Lysobacter sp. cf310 TaxID=1761790 RepID=UPI0008E55A6D|nr:M28 family peptidase [Lysobacter sp. cf310]SFK96723.1 Peptidase family M28 [Lysobacter sp. cf310]
MPHKTRLVALALSLAIAACAQTAPVAAPVAPPPSVDAASQPAAAGWLADVVAMSESQAAGGRRSVIQRRLDGLGIPWRGVPFSTGEHSGENLLAEVSGEAAAPLLLLGAHSDKVDVGHGATDNASGSAVVLALAERFKREPLQHHRVAVAFWDLEELGLLGAKAYVADGKVKPALYVNFDVFGWGDTLWMMTPDANQPLVAASRAATDETGLGLSAGDKYPPSDHLAFLKAGWPAVSYSLLGADEIPLTLQVFAGKKPKPVPKVMQVIHSEADTVSQIDAAAAARGVDAVERALRRWDAQSTP